MVQISLTYVLAAIAVSAAYVAAAPAPNPASLGSQYLQSRQQPNYGSMMRRRPQESAAALGAALAAEEGASLDQQEEAALQAMDNAKESGNAAEYLAALNAAVAIAELAASA